MLSYGSMAIAPPRSERLRTPYFGNGYKNVLLSQKRPLIPGYSSQLLTERDWRPLPLELVLSKT